MLVQFPFGLKVNLLQNTFSILTSVYISSYLVPYTYHPLGKNVTPHVPIKSFLPHIGRKCREKKIYKTYSSFF